MGIFSRLIGNTLWGTKSDDPTMLASVDVTNHAAHTANMAQEPGHDTELDRNWGGAQCELVEITGVTDGQAITGPCTIYGFHVTAVGTSTTVDLHQGTSTSGINLAPGIATGTVNVLGYSKAIGMPGVGVYCPNGIYVNWGGTGTPKVALHVVLGQAQ